MEARPHPMAFAKRLLPNLAFSSFDRVYAELCGHKREAFLMYLWQQAAQGLPEPVKPVDVGKQPGGTGQAVVKLEVVGALERGGQQIVVVSMPPAVAPNEAVFVALVRGGGQVRVFTLERCRDAAGALSPSETVLAAITPEGRSNFGFLEGDGLETFKARLGQILGVPLDGLEQSLPPIDLAAFAAPGAGSASGGRAAPSQPAAWLGAQKVAGVLLPLAGARAVFPVLFRVVPIAVPGIRPLLDLLSLAVVVTLLVWLYRVFDAYRGQTKYSPGMAVGGWFIPLGNLVLPALVVRDAHDTVTKQSGTGLVFGWWLAWLVNTGMMVAWTAVVEGLRGGADAASTLSLLSWVTSIAAALNYGLLFVIVKKVDGR